MPNDLDIIHRLEKKLWPFQSLFGRGLMQLEGRIGVNPRLPELITGYELNAAHQVISLSLYNMELTEFPEEIYQLQSLKTLELDTNRLTLFPKEITRLQQLQWLNLGTNRLTKLPKEIGQLKQLQVLNLIDNQLTQLPKEIAQLQQLRYLFLTENRLTQLPQEIGQLHQLQWLGLWNNRLTQLPKEIGQLQNLQVLDLGHNQLTQLPKAKEIGQLQNLQVLDLSHNQLTQLSKELLQLNLEVSWIGRYWLARDGILVKGILVKDNPFQIPPVEIVKQGRQAIIDYYKALEEEQAKPRPLNELKLLLVGDGGAGKTSLLKRLLGQTFDPNETQTHGINLNTLEMDIPDNPQFSGGPVKLHCWDFGGQEMMHATHQFFLSKRSLYVLVIDGRKEEKIDYWLKHIHSFGENSPVIIVINKMDENPSFDLPRKQWQEKYPNIQQFCRISCRTGEGLDTLKQTIQQTIPHVELVQTVFPANWWQVKTDLEQLTEKDKDYLSYDHYLELCQTHDIVEESAQQTLITFLHDLGIIIHFDQKLLRETNVINPRWLTEAVYKLITAPQVIQQQGVLFTRQLTELLDARIYPSHKHDYLLELLKKFELGYALTADKFLFPDLFPVQEPNVIFDENHALHFVLEYDFLPKSVISRFIVKMHSDIKENLYWRTGVLIYDPSFDTTAVIRAIDNAKRIHIYVTGQHPREYLAIILFVFRDIHHSFAKLTVKEKIGLPDNPDVMVSYTHLLNLEKQGKATYTPEDSDVSYDVKMLLGTIHNPHATEAEMLAILRKIESVVGEKSEEGILEQVNDVFKINPEFFGIGVDINELVKKIGGWVKKLRKTE